MVILDIGQVLRTDYHVAAQLRSIATEIDKCDSRSNTEKHVVVVRAINENKGTHHRWRIWLLLRLNLQSLAPLFLDHRITDIREATLAGECHNLPIQSCRVHWFSQINGHFLLYRGCEFG